LIDRLLKWEGGPTEVTNGGETAHQRALGLRRSEKDIPASAVIAVDNGRPAKSECQCASIRPGITRPPQSMTCAPSGGGGLPATTS
jgi:hypothetical protein